jgi:outer membrane protein TolC
MRFWSCRLSGLVLPLAVLLAQTACAEPVAAPAAPAVAKELVVGLEIVFRIAYEQNATIGQARARVAEAEAAALVAESSCVPNVLRNEANRRVTTEAKVWQQRAELARTTHEVLQEAGSTYYDWLAARRGEAIARGLLAKEEKLLGRAKALAKDEQAANVLVENIETALAGRRQSIHKFHYQASAAAAKLAYLLNLSGMTLIAADTDLAVVELAASDQSVDALVQQARSTGPGIAELTSLEEVIEKGIADARCMQKACDLTGKPAFCGRLDIAHSRLEQVRQARADLAGKYEALVRDAHASIESGHEEIKATRDQVRHATEANRLANVRLDDMVSSTTIAEVLQSIRSLESAHYGYLQAVNSHDKAHVRLHVTLTQPGGK